MAAILVLQLVDIRSALARLGDLHPDALLLAVMVIPAQFVIRTMRWRALLVRAAGSIISLRRVAAPLAVGYLFNTALPARLGEPTRLVLVARREAIPIGRVGATIVVERVFDLGALLAIAALVARDSGAWRLGFIVFVIASAATLLAFVLGGSTRWRGAATRLGLRLDAAMLGFREAVEQIGVAGSAQALAFSVTAWVGELALFWAAGQAVGINLSPAAAMAIAIGAALGTTLPAAAGYLGTYELGAVLMGSTVGVPADMTLSIAIVAHAVATIPLAALGAGVMVAMGARAGGRTFSVAHSMPGAGEGVE